MNSGGKLYFGTFIAVFGLVMSGITCGLLYVLFFINHNGQEAPLLFMIAMFGFFAGSCWAELAWTKGTFDDEGIRFRSIWKGLRCQNWSELIGIEFDPGFDYYILTFDDGTKIRISKFMRGHRELLTHARSLGHLF